MNQVISISSLFSASIYYTKFIEFNCQGKIEGRREKRYIENAEVYKKELFNDQPFQGGYDFGRGYLQSRQK